MATHILSRPDGKQYYLTLTPEQSTSMRTDIRDNTFLEVKDDAFYGKGCKLDVIGGGDDVNQSSRLQVEKDVFFLPGGERSTGFWQQVLKINQTRKAEGKPWIFAQAIDKARTEASFTRPQDIIDFIDAEYETFRAVNRPMSEKPSAEVKQLTREFYATDKGRDYLQKVRNLGWQ